MFASLLLLGLALQAAPPAPATPAPTTVSPLVVEGRPYRKPDDPAAEVQAFTASPPDTPIARWHLPVCPAVAGLSPAQKQRLGAAISAIAGKVGASVGKAGCAPNLVVFVTDDPDGVAQALVDKHPGMFGEVRHKDVLADLQRPRPVRWWSGTLVKSYAGQELQRIYDQATGNTYTTLNAYRSSHIVPLVRTDIVSVVAVVDAREVDGVPLAALAGHIAIGALAQVRAQDGFPGLDTVMNLFVDHAAGKSPPAGLTGWDTAYLKALYATEPARVPSAQRWEIGTELDRNLSAGSSTAGRQRPPAP